MLNLDQNTVIQFYQNLGKLFYAVAAIDNRVRPEEVDAVVELVKRYWLNPTLISESSISDAQNAILETFNWLRNDKEYDAEKCYLGFINFKRQNEAIFTDSINTLILKTAGKISASFSGQNKSELILLAKLNIELKKR